MAPSFTNRSKETRMAFLEFLPVIGKVLDRILPDPQAKAEAQLKLAQLAHTGDLAMLDAEVKLATAQTAVNQVEAANPKPFVSGWRPMVGWVCATGMASAFVVGPFFTWASAWIATGHPGPWPTLDTGTLMTCLMGMLGLGTLRTYEKKNGVAS